MIAAFTFLAIAFGLSGILLAAMFGAEAMRNRQYRHAFYQFLGMAFNCFILSRLI